MPRRGPEAGFHRIHYDFHGLGVTPIDSCPFLQTRFFKKIRNAVRRTGLGKNHHVLLESWLTSYDDARKISEKNGFDLIYIISEGS